MSEKRVQLKLSPDALQKLEGITAQANEGFSLGSISQSDVVEELVLAGKIDFKALQRKHLDVKKWLKSLASQDSVDLDQAIRSLDEFRNASPTRRSSTFSKKVEE